MLGTNYVLTGEIVENGSVIVQGALAVYVTEYDISMRKHIEGMNRGKTLIVQPFNPKMFWEQLLRADTRSLCKVIASDFTKAAP